MDSRLGTKDGTYFRISVNLVRVNNYIFKMNNDTNYSIGFCAVRCENAGIGRCQFFILIRGVCYQGSSKPKSPPVVHLGFGYQLAYYRQSE